MADTPELGRLERFALRYLERAYGRVPARVDDAEYGYLEVTARGPSGVRFPPEIANP